MQIVGLVTEYNPFHNGHLHHLRTSLEKTNTTHSVAIMSGHFLQRGVPALIDKWQRAKMAVDAGVDLVIELPVIYATGSAEFFAEGAIAHLEALGCIDSVCFGSEAGSVNELQQIAETFLEEPPVFKEALKAHLENGLPFPTARSKALGALFKTPTLEALASSPNNILGIEYIKAIKRLQSSIQPATIPRLGAGYHTQELEGDICSATAIRSHMVTANRPFKELEAFMPSHSYRLMREAYDQENYAVLNDYYDFLRYKLHTHSPNDLRRIMDVSEGLENLLKSAVKTADSVDDLIQTVKSKRYTQTRIQRILIHLLLDLDTDFYQEQSKARYLRVLAMNTKGMTILASIRKDCETPIITNLSKFNTTDETTQKYLERDLMATDIYRMNPRWKKTPLGSDYRTIPYIKK